MTDEQPDAPTQELIAERQDARARADRRGFAATNSRFIRTMRGAIRQYLVARANGLEREIAINGLEAELRGAWPKSVSKFAPACDDCGDTGWREEICYEWRKCGREVCMANPERQHTFTELCSCAAGDKRRPQARSGNDPMASVGRTSKKKQRTFFSRIGG